MSFRTRARRWPARGGAAAIVLLASAGAQAAAAAAPAAAAPAATAAGAPPVTDPYAPAYHHPYRHGAVPTLGAAARMTAWAKRHPGAASASPAVVHGAAADSARNVSYGGGSPDGTGVTIGDEKVYLVFYGSQWGKQTTKGGIMTFSHDPSGEARYVQELFKGLGTGGEQWSGVATQYCQGVSPGTQTCPSTAPHVAYPHGGALAGIWYDNSAKSPAHATGHQLGLQAVAAATHFHNTTTGTNRNASYIILSATGTDPDNYKEQGFCAWHDFTGDTAMSGGAVTPPAGYGQLAFTNMPYVTDAGAGCGEHFVRAGQAGKLDGVSIVVGHEYAETITDQEPPSGWTGPQDEVADACAWRQTGLGRVALLTLPTGTFAMQGIWANNANGGTGGCRFTQAVKTTQLLQNPGFEAGVLAPWTASSPGVLQPASPPTDPAHSGSWLAVLGGGTAPQTGSLAQTVRVAPGVGRYGAATFSFWLKITTDEPGSKAVDTLKVQELTTGGTVLKTLATYSNRNAGGYAQHSFSLSPGSYHGQPGQQITLKFTATETVSGHTTSFLIDDTALNAS